ncbi:MAG: vWA domain-containing protein, partial [Planctomycetota bacterium]
MIFPAPIFLYLLPLAGLPIVFHFILKQKKRTMVFSTLMFFHRTDPKLNSHRKIRQWLLLLLRILLIAFILLALSRPIFQSSAGALGGKISVVAVVDNSGSMNDGAGYDNDKTKLECAVGAARRLITTLEVGSEAAVVLLVDDPAVEPAEGRSDRNPALVGDRLTTDKESLLALLDKIRSTQATGDAGRALARAFKLLRASSAGGGAVHVFSDLQQAEWGGPNPGKDSELPGASGAPIAVYVHKIEPEIRDEANVAITAIQLPEERILPKHTYSIGLALQNNSDIVANIRVNSIDSQGGKNTENVTLERGRAKTVEVETKPDENGYHWVKVWIEGDGFSADNEAGVGIFCEETATIMFGGTPEEFGVLPVALSPSGQGQFTGMVAEFRLPGQLSQTATEEKPIMIVATWTGLQLIGESSVPLQEYVEAGGNLLV